jgi:hypothetical protein
LTDHKYHYPPQLLLNRAVGQVWQGDTPVKELYDFREADPDFVLLGGFSSWVNVYPPEALEGEYASVAKYGPYELFGRTQVSDSD